MQRGRLSLLAALCAMLAACSSGAPSPGAAPTMAASTLATSSVPTATPASRPVAVASGSAEDARIKAAPRQRIRETDEFGLVASATRTRDGSVTVQIDRVDMLGGADAVAAAAARGDEVSNDYYLVNENPILRRYTVPQTSVIWGSIALHGTPEVARVSFSDWVAFVTSEESGGTLFHLDVEDGLVVAVEEQYRP